MRVSFRRLIYLIVCTLAGVWLIANVNYQQEEPRVEIPSDHHLCVLIPFRNVEHELSILIPELDAFLLNQSVKHSFLVLNQTDSYRFNRASLINVGWLEADKIGCDYMVMHDVDIVPLNPNLNYRYPGEGVIRHISSGDYHPIKRYNYKKFIGGVLMLTMKDFKKVNGMSNKYWGWGLEDDEFYIRMKEKNLTSNIERPRNLTTDRHNTFKHIHGPERKRDYAMIGPQKKMSRKRDRISGLDTVQYTIVKRENLMFGDQKNIPVLSIHIQLVCDFTWTPYCTF
ncbi:unnamed protein product [Bursaphelenchus xylophilus]|uniref:(pine wood nematode) hypothetical protein n=1 Tax=Bursaphelenchus xylophilus TaxID=6326 RepID=A0A1I7STK8_BURXY|nr:unnamed protein product [Bursaphelenchus xylophilus]CAG9108280.1 unnamed protein product [Bursaphelenchus xylophilus]